MSGLVPPEVPEPVRAQLGIADRMLDVLVAEVVLQSSSIVAVIGQLEAAGMAQHVWMRLDFEPCRLRGRSLAAGRRS